MTNLRSTLGLLRTARKLAVACAFAVVIPGATAAQTNTFPSSGNVGVGTTSPGNKLEVKGGSGPTDGAVDGLVLSTTRTEFTTKGRVASNFDGLYLSQNAYYNNFAWVADNTSRSVALIVLEAGNANSGISFFTSATNNNGSGTERMRIDKNGNVGVGTTGPTDKLEVRANTAGQAAISGSQAATSGTNYGLFGQATGSGATTNIGGYLSASGATNNYGLIVAAGNVGIGTASPGSKLEINLAGTEGTGLNVLSGASNKYALIQWGRTSAEGTLAISRSAGAFFADSVPGDTWFGSTNGTIALGDQTTGTASLIVKSGNVGIGTTSPTKKLHVAGDIQVDGNINAKYQDLAEWVPSSQQLSAGTVVVLDTTKSNQVVSSNAAYDTRVAGVISTQPGITLGEGGEGKVLVATTGRVRVKVDASRGPIQIGDLLVTSDLQGVAMKSEAVNLGGVQIHRPGTIVGKALEPLAKGSGEILVLLSLQ